MRIRVTQDDILRGKMASITDCPVARAVRRARGRGSIEVGSWQAVIAGQVYTLPENAHDAIEEFDDTGIMKPFTFSLPINKKAT